MVTALIFPGQGSQAPGMRELAERQAPELVELVDAEVGADPFERVDEGTEFAQPAILCAGLAAWRGAGAPGAALFAGHSLGELGALAAAGAIEAEDAVRLAVVRGRLMEEAGGQSGGGMLALLGDGEAAREAASAAGTILANDNGPTQIVVAGPRAALEATRAEAKARGVRVMGLAVSAAFHTPEMEPAVRPFRAALERVELKPASAPVLSSATARPFALEPDTVRDALAAAITQPVRWRETMAELHCRGVRRFVEAGPGKALTGLARRSFDDVEATTLAAGEPARV